MPYLETLMINDNMFTGNIQDMSFPRTIKLLDISSNYLTGDVPSTFLQYVPQDVQVVLDLSDNKITGIHESICSMSNLNRGDVEKYGCNGLMCPIDYYSNTGRQSSLGECLYCPSASYLGSTKCLDNKNGPGAALWAPLVIGLLTIFGLIAIVYRRTHRLREMVSHEDVESLILEPDGSTLNATGCLA